MIDYINSHFFLLMFDGSSKEALHAKAILILDQSFRVLQHLETLNYSKQFRDFRIKVGHVIFLLLGPIAWGEEEDLYVPFTYLA